MVRDILYAQSVAVVGGSNNPEKWGYQITVNLLRAGYNGSLYIINSREKEVLGLPSYPTVLDIPGTVELLIIVVPPAAIPEVLRQGGAKKAKGAVILTGGFREAGNEEQEKELLQIAVQYGMRLVGPNVQGINNTFNRMCAVPFPYLNCRGPIGIISQSGSVSATLGEWAEMENIGFSSMINLGNQADLCETDFLEFFAEDPHTNVIALYLEGPKDGKRFKEVLQKVTLKKPVVILKPGRTSGGQSAAASHTASIAGNDSVFTTACRQYGAIRAAGMEEFFDIAKTLGFLSLTKGNTIGLGTTSGGTISLFLDEAESCGLEYIPPPPAAVQEIKTSEFLTPYVINVGKYLDIIQSNKTVWREILGIIAKHPLADMYNIIIADPKPGVEEAIIAFAHKIKQPVVCTYMGGGQAEKDGRELLQQNSIPCFPTPERAAHSLAALLRYSEYRRKAYNE